MIAVLEKYYQVKIVPENTLIIFDEIQMCERALTSLKYFSEEAPEYHVMAAGSLLVLHSVRYGTWTAIFLPYVLYSVRHGT